MRDAKFPPVTREQWRAQAETDLRGRPLTSLTRTTADGIAVPPLFMAEDLADVAVDSLPGRFPHTRGRTAQGPGRGRGWLAVQEIRHADPRAANLAARADLRRGAQGVRFVLDGQLQAGRETGAPPDGLVLDPFRDLDVLLAGIDPLRTPVYFEAGLMAPALLDSIEEWLDERGNDEQGRGDEQGVDEQGADEQGLDEQGLGRGPVRGGVIYDPLSPLLRTGGLACSIDEALARQVDAVLGSERGLIGVSTAPFHDAGAGDAEALALALATCAELLRRGEALGLEPADLAGDLLWTVSIAGRPFEAIAALRAARTLWAKFAAACGLSAEGPALGLWIHAVPSQRNITRFDPWVNLLRGTVGCFAAAVGGADSIATAAFDGLCGPEGAEVDGLGRGSALGRRLALNTQLILREESHLGHVIDPAGGSWAIEALTDAVARTAWDRFRQIEGEGGLIAGLVDRRIHGRIAAQAERLRAQVATRKLAITGVSTFALADADEHAPPAQSANTFTDGEGPEPLATTTDTPAAIQPLPRLRLAAPFEALRDAARAWTREHGQPPRIASLNLGPLARHQARADFAANCFRAGGLVVVGDAGEAGLDTVDDAVAEFRRSGCKLAVICGADADLPSRIAPLIVALRTAGAEAIWLAARPPIPDEWGLDPELPPRLVFIGCDLLAELEHALRTLAVIDGDDDREEA